MKKLEFSTEINASKEKVWEALWKAENYAEWTKAFAEGSHIKGNLEEGEIIQFLDGNNNGMFAKVASMIPNEKMYFIHLGEVKNGESGEIIYDQDSMENYDLQEVDGITNLKATLKAPEEYIQFFANVFPAVLATVKEIAER